jgi:phosphoglycolate phosphatase
MQPKLIIFDLDGTLVDSLDDLTEAVNRMRDSFGREPLRRDEVQCMVGQGASVLVERALPGLSAAENAQGLALFLRYNEEHLADHTLPYPGIPELLATLCRQGVRLAVVSNKHVALCRQLLTSLGLAHFFVGIYGADSFAERKPSPLPFQEVLRLQLVPAEAAVVVGDSANDVAAALAAGIRVLGCSYGYGTAEELQPADAVVATVKELLPLLAPQVIDPCV